MLQKFLNFFDFKTTLVINLVGFAVALASGPAFYQSGMVQGLAVFFIILALVAVSVRYVDDQYLRRFLEQATAIALLIFAGAHSIVFFWNRNGGNMTLAGQGDFALISLVNLHLAGLIVILIGAEFILKTYRRSKSWFGIWALSFLALVPVILTPILTYQGFSIPLDTTSPVPWVYLMGFVGIFLLGFLTLLQIREIVPLLRRFAELFLAAFVTATISAMTVIFQQFFVVRMEVPSYLLVYIAYFFLYCSMAFLYLTATERFGNISPLYKEVDDFIKAGRVVKKGHRLVASKIKR